MLFKQCFKTLALVFLLSSQVMAEDLIEYGAWENQDWSKAMTYEVVIDRNINEVWDYVSDSGHGTQWSIYFHHLKVLPSEFADGKVGSLRRCFRNADETGVFWDEKVLFVEKHKTRIILSYDFKGFLVSPKSFTTFVKQSYRDLGNNRTALSFSTIPTETMNFIAHFIFYFSRAQVEDVFRKNLTNIKNHIEGKESTFPYTVENYNFFED